MDLQSKRNGSGGSEALEPVELPPSEKSHHALYPHLAEEKSQILHYWRILQKRKWMMVATFAIVFALAVIAVLSQTRLYQATSKVAIFPEVPNVLGFKDLENSSPDYEYDATLETQVAILRSDALALKVIEAMRLYQNPRFTTVRQNPPESSMPDSSMQPDPTQAAGLLGAFRGGLNIQLVPKFPPDTNQLHAFRSAIRDRNYEYVGQNVHRGKLQDKIRFGHPDFRLAFDRVG